MDKQLKQQLQTIITGHRPRPLMYIGRHNGRKCYVRKQDLTYWQLREKYPPVKHWWNRLKFLHIWQKKHFLKSNGFNR